MNYAEDLFYAVMLRRSSIYLVNVQLMILGTKHGKAMFKTLRKVYLTVVSDLNFRSFSVYPQHGLFPD